MGANGSSEINLKNIFVDDLKNTYESNRSLNCGISGSGTNEIVIGPSDGCTISVKNTNMANEYQSFCDVEMAFKTAADSELSNKIDNTVANEIIQEGLGILQDAEMTTNVQNKIQNMITNNSFNSEYVRCTNEHNFTNRITKEACKNSSISVEDTVLNNLGKIDCLLDSSFEAKAKAQIENDAKNDIENKIKQVGLFASASCAMILLIILVMAAFGGMPKNNKNSNTNSLFNNFKK